MWTVFMYLILWCSCCFFFFFFKQKTAYELRISDWSSDVCSSDLLPVVVMTGFGDIPMSVRAMKSGAVDFLPKPFNDQDMLDAVLAAIERDRQQRAVDRDISKVRERFETLSAREQQVMQLVTVGKLNKQVAGDLGISEVTVKIHRAAVMRKMGARSLADLIRMADVIGLKQQP